MPKFHNPFKRTATSSDAQPSRRKSSAVHQSIGTTVGPGRVLGKEERLHRRAQRMDSVIGSLDGQTDEQINYEVEHNWTAFKAKFAADRWWSRTLERLGWHMEHNFAPGAAIAALQELRSGKRPYSLRSIICTGILLLLVFGASYVLLEYLLLATRVSACSVTTVYVPVAYTVTQGMSLASPSPSPLTTSNQTSAAVTHTSTSTRTSTLRETLTSVLAIASNSSSSELINLATGPTYFYTTNSLGSTEWRDGVSPSSGASSTTMTTTIVMKPFRPGDPALTSLTNIATVTPPAYTSTVYTFQSPDLTSTSTSTYYTTYTVSQVNQSLSGTNTRTAHHGVGSSGWNVSATETSRSVNAASTAYSASTHTTVGYFAIGDDITSTTTLFTTTTVAVQYTTTIYPTTESSLGDPYVTTITALPVTITPGSSEPLPSAGPQYSSSSLSIASSGTSSVSASNTTGTVSTHYRKSKASASPLSMSAPAGARSSSTSSMLSRVSNSSSTASVTQQGSIARTSPENSSSLNTHRSLNGSITKTYPVGATLATESSTTSAVTSVLSLASNYSFSTFTAQITTTVSGFGGLSSSSAPTVNASGTFSSQDSIPASSSASTSQSSVWSGSPKPSSSTAIGPAKVSQPTHYTSSSLVVSSSASVRTASSSRSRTTHAKGTPLTASRSKSMLRSGMTTSARPSKTMQPTTESMSMSLTASGIFTSGTTTELSTRSPLPTTRSKGLNTTSVISQPAGSSAASQSSGTGLMPSSTADESTNPFPASRATATPTAGCGEQGDFVLTFDDLPNFLSTGQNNSDIFQAPPIFSPYHHLTFSDGYVYAPEPNEPYQPTSPPHLAVFLANATGRMSSASGSLVKPGEIGDGPRDPISAFWFDAHSAYFGCDNPGPGACTLTFKAFTWNPAANAETLVYTQHASIPPCTTMNKLDCRLQRVDFSPSFRQLTGLQVQAFTSKGMRMFFMDDLALAWSNSSCAAGMLRQSSQ